MRNLLFASVQNGNSGAENIWMVYKSDTASLFTFSATELEEAKEYALTPERTVYRKDRKQVAYVNKSVVMGRGKTGVVLVLDFDAIEESSAQGYAAEIIGAPCPAWLNMETVVTTQDAEKHLAAPNIFTDWVSRSPLGRSYVNQNAVLALIDAIVKGAKRPILLYSSRSGGDVSIPSEVDTVLKTALLSLPIAIANEISFSTYTSNVDDLNGMDVACVSSRGMEVNAAWKNSYTAIDIANVVWERSTFYGKLVEKSIRSRNKLTAPLSGLTTVAELERVAAMELFHATLDEMAGSCSADQLQTLYRMYRQSGAEKSTEERKALYLHLSQKQVVVDGGERESALIYWLETIERLLPIPAPKQHCDLPGWKQGYDLLNKLSSELGAIVIEEFRRFEEGFFAKVSLEELKDKESKAESNQFYREAKKLKFFDLEEVFRKKFITPQDSVTAIGAELELAKKYFHCSEEKIKAEFCNMLFKADRDWCGGTGEAVAFLSWMRADLDLSEKILDDVPRWISAKLIYEKHCAEEQKSKLYDLFLKKCEEELSPHLGIDARKCKQKWEELKREKPDVHRIEKEFGFRIEKYEERCRENADREFRKAYEQILKDPDCTDGKIEETRIKYDRASDEEKKIGYQAIFKDTSKRDIAARCVMTWESLSRRLDTASVLTRWKKALLCLRDYLGRQYSDQTVVLSKAFKNMCCGEVVDAKRSPNFWLEILKVVEDLTNEKLIQGKDGQDIKKHLFDLFDKYFKGLLKGAEDLPLVTSESRETYRDLLGYGYSGQYKKQLQTELDQMHSGEVVKDLEASCESFYKGLRARDPVAEEETKLTKTARRREIAWRAGGIVCRLVVWFAIVAVGVALISVLSPQIMKWVGIADTVDIILSVMHLQFLNAPLAWGGLAAMVYLLTSVYHCVMHEKSMDGWQIIGKSSRNMMFGVLIPYAFGFATLLIIFMI